MQLAVLLVGLLVASAQDCCPHNAARCSNPLMGELRLPAGFCINEFAQLSRVRTLHVQTDPRLGTVVFAGNVSPNMVVLIDANGDGVSDETITWNTGLNRQMSATFDTNTGALWCGQSPRILKYENIMDDLAARRTPTQQVLYDSFDPGSYHGYRYVNIAPNGDLFVMSGTPCNVCRAEELRCASGPDECFYGHVLHVNTTNKDRILSSDWQRWASGMRNSAGFDFSPHDGTLWFTDNGRDSWGDNRPPDELNHAPVPGLDFGFPNCHAFEPDPDFNSGDCSQYEPPAATLGPHVATLGMKWYTGNSFPPPYDDGIFIAEHGSFDRREFIGFRLTHVTVRNGKAQEDFVPFMEGFLQNNVFGTRWGRPTDVEVLPDGSLILADDLGGIVWRISWEGKADA